ncbi:MAG: sortase [Oscillospiraceae bacterium]|jgi:sortase A|nr:sortase [Oscillospiraceae bacterium]
MKKLLTLLLAIALSASISIPVFAADYSFGTGTSTLDDFGGATSTDAPVTPDPLSANTRRNKDAAYFPPPFGVFSGDIPTDPSSKYHANYPESGSVPVAQELPKTGSEDYAPGSGTINVNYDNIGFLPTTSQTAALNTSPWYYEDGSIGTLYVARTGKTIKIYEGESLSNLKIGAGHFAATSAWDGNVALAGHNRGGSAYFSFVKDLKNGDKLTYTTKYGARTYEVYSKIQIDEYDNLPLSWSADNILTLITCVADVPELRYCAQAREVK